jgi:hypothetical protein
MKLRLSCYHSCPGYLLRHELNVMAEMLSLLSGISISPWTERHGCAVINPVRDIYLAKNWTSWLKCYHSCLGYLSHHELNVMAELLSVLSGISTSPCTERHGWAVINPVRDIYLTMYWTSWLSCYHSCPGYLPRQELNVMAELLSLLSRISISPRTERHGWAVITPVRDICLALKLTQWLSCYHSCPGYLPRQELNVMAEVVNPVRDICLALKLTQWLSCYHSCPGYLPRHEHFHCFLHLPPIFGGFFMVFSVVHGEFWVICLVNGHGLSILNLSHFILAMFIFSVIYSKAIPVTGRGGL